MSAQHTPGPWVVGKVDIGVIGDVSSADGVQSVAQAQQIIGDSRTQDTRKANARLIAAAPELLEALEVAINFIENTECELGITLESGDKARAAIAKATGEAA